MSEFKRFEDLEIWKKARELVQLIYEASSIGNFSKDFALKDQVRRASISILSNIAEGFERNNKKEFLIFLSYSKGSCGEVRAQLYIALDQKYLSCDVFETLSNNTIVLSKMISGFMKYLRNSTKVSEKSRSTLQQ